MKYSIFNSVKSTSCHQVSVAELLERIGMKELKDKCAKIQAHILAGEEKEANQLKNELPCIVVSELYKEGAPRKKGTGTPTGLFMMDWDDCKSLEELAELRNKIKTLALSHPVLKDLIVAGHDSPRQHGVHVFSRWIDGCQSIEECQAKFAEMADLPNYDKGCKDPSRCSYLVHKDMFFVQNWGAMERNEEYAKIQSKTLKKNGKHLKSNGTRNIGADTTDGSIGGADNRDYSDTEFEQRLEEVSKQLGVGSEDEMWGELRLRDIFDELTRLCAPKEKLLPDGSVDKGGRDTALMSVYNLFRYLVDRKPERILAYTPKWGVMHELNNPGKCRDMAERVCERNLATTMPKTLRQALDNLTKKESESLLTEEEKNDMYCEEMKQIEESQRFFFEIPKELPPVIHEFVRAFPFAWKPGAILSLLPVLGTLTSKVRALYLDKRFHSLSFQTVIEADYACGKGNISDMVRFCIAPLTAADAIGNEKLNKYNELTKMINQTEKLPEPPDVCVRKIVGEFTVAGFNDTMTTAKGLHIWCSTSEIDEVRRIWGEVSYILRKAYDNDLYGRNLRSKDQYRGERPVYFNTLLCGTPKRVNMVYNDPEDGLVSRTMFFRLLQDDGKIPVVSMSEKTKSQLSAFIQKLHDKFSLGQDGKPVEEQRYVLDYLNKAMEKWLNEKYQDSVTTGNMAEDAFRRRDAVNGFRAGVLAHIIYAEKFGDKMKEVHKKAATAFALWVAEYSLRSHMAKFGTELQRDDVSVYGKSIHRDNILRQLPDVFSIAEAYEKMKSNPRVTVRTILQRLVSAGYLKREDRGFYKKTNKK